jgi:hypothetical protein
MHGMRNVTVVDETTSGRGGAAWELAVAEERPTLRDVIRCRVRQEVERYNAAQEERVFHGLVQPTGAERLLNGYGDGHDHKYRLAEHRVVDADEHFRLALEAFGRNGFLVLVGDRQVEDLDTVLDLAPEGTVSFLKLVPLVGG